MKAKLLPLVVGIAVSASGAAFAEAPANGPSLYGKVLVGVAKAEMKNAGTSMDQWEVQSNSSRVGVKGSQALTPEGMSVFYQYEWTVDVDDAASDLGSRDRFVGVKTDVGAFQLGRFDTPLKKSQGKVDMFGDFAPDIANIGTAVSGAAVKGDRRESNLLQYTSPKIADAVQVSLALQPGEAAGTDDGLADATSISVVYVQDALYAALAMDSEINGNDTTRATVQYMGDGFTVGGLWETSEPSTTSTTDTTTLVLSGSYDVNDMVTAKAQLQTTTVDTAGTEVDTQATTIGMDYKLGKKTTAQVFYHMAEVDGGADYNELNLGLIHSF